MTSPGTESVAPAFDPWALVFFAVPEEAGPFVRGWRGGGRGAVRKVPGPGVACWDLHAGVSGIRVHVTGMGPRNAAQVGAAALDSCPATRMIVTAGFAGGLDPALHCGDVLMDADAGFPLIGTLALSGARTGRFHESARVAVTAAEKALLREETGADAVEMESTTLRRLARQRDIPAATVRVISDEAGETLPLDFNALMTRDHRIDFPRLAWTLVRSLRSVPRLLRFQKTVGRAADSLAIVLIQTVGAYRSGGIADSR